MEHPEVMPATESPSEGVAFEVAMQRLEKIVEEMESAQMPLDELLDRYEEGTKLIQVCQNKLQAAEQRIEMVALRVTETSPASVVPPKLSSSKPTENDVSLF